MNSHPGWAVRYSNGSWLSGGHGFFQTEEGDIELSKEDAQRAMQWAGFPDGEVVVAWEPRCHKLERECTRLKAACGLTPDDIEEASEKLDEVMTLLRGRATKK